MKVIKNSHVNVFTRKGKHERQICDYLTWELLQDYPSYLSPEGVHMPSHDLLEKQKRDLVFVSFNTSLLLARPPRERSCGCGALSFFWPLPGEGGRRGGGNNMRNLQDKILMSLPFPLRQKEL